MDFFTRTKKILLPAGLAVVALLVLAVVSIMPKSIETSDILVTNITDTSATLVWTTREPTKGVVYLADSSSKTPVLGTWELDKYYDLRDMVPDNLGNKVFGGSINKYTVHSVLVNNLNPESEYVLMLGDGTRSYANEEGKITIAVNTAITPEQIATPNPAYGEIQGLDSSDAVIVAQALDNESQPIGTLVSTIVTKDFTYALDLSGIRSADLKNVIPETDVNNITLNLITSEEYDGSILKATSGTHQPVLPMLVSKKQSSTSNNNSLIQTLSLGAYAAECTTPDGTNGFECSCGCVSAQIFRENNTQSCSKVCAVLSGSTTPQTGYTNGWPDGVARPAQCENKYNDCFGVYGSYPTKDAYCQSNSNASGKCITGDNVCDGGFACECQRTDRSTYKTTASTSPDPCDPALPIGMTATPTPATSCNNGAVGTPLDGFLSDVLTDATGSNPVCVGYLPTTDGSICATSTKQVSILNPVASSVAADAYLYICPPDKSRDCYYVKTCATGCEKVFSTAGGTDYRVDCKAYAPPGTIDYQGYSYADFTTADRDYCSKTTANTIYTCNQLTGCRNPKTCGISDNNKFCVNRASGATCSPTPSVNVTVDTACTKDFDPCGSFTDMENEDTSNPNINLSIVNGNPEQQWVTCVDETNKVPKKVVLFSCDTPAAAPVIKVERDVIDAAATEFTSQEDKYVSSLTSGVTDPSVLIANGAIPQTILTNPVFHALLVGVKVNLDINAAQCPALQIDCNTVAVPDDPGPGGGSNFDAKTIDLPAGKLGDKSSSLANGDPYCLTTINASSTAKKSKYSAPYHCNGTAWVASVDPYKIGEIETGLCEKATFTPLASGIRQYKCVLGDQTVDIGAKPVLTSCKAEMDAIGSTYPEWVGVSTKITTDVICASSGPLASLYSDSGCAISSGNATILLDLPDDFDITCEYPEKADKATGKIVCAGTEKVIIPGYTDLTLTCNYGCYEAPGFECSPTSNMFNTLRNNLLLSPQAQSAGNGNKGFDGPGEYAINLNGYDVTTGNIRVAEVDENGNPIVLYFNDKNSNGVRDEGEELVPVDSKAISIEKVDTGVPFQMNVGWNLVGFPVFIKDRSERTAKGLLTSMNEQGFFATHIAKYSDGKWHVLSYRKDEKSYFGNDFELLPGEGYFIKSFNKGLFTIIGNKYTDSVPVQFAAGWNLVNVVRQGDGYTATSLLNALNTATMPADTVSDYSSGLYHNLVQQGGVVYGSDFDINESKGYFIRVDQLESTKVWTP